MIIAVCTTYRSTECTTYRNTVRTHAYIYARVCTCMHIDLLCLTPLISAQPPQSTPRDPQGSIE